LIWIYLRFAEKASQEEAVKTALINRIKDRMQSTEATTGPNFLAIDHMKEELLGVNNIKSKH